MPLDEGRHFGVFEEDGLREGGLAPSVLAVILNLALLQEEFHTTGVSFGRRQMKRGSTVVVAQVHVHTLVVGAGIAEKKIV